MTVLAKNSNAGVRSAVAWTATTPPDLLALLAKDPDASVRSGVAGNTAAPPDLLALLANDANASLRSGVAWNGVTLPEDLWLLQSGGRSFWQMIVRRIFATSGATSPDPGATFTPSISRHIVSISRPPESSADADEDSDERLLDGRGRGERSAGRAYRDGWGRACLDGAPSSRVWLRLCERIGCGHVFGLT